MVMGLILLLLYGCGARATEIPALEQIKTTQDAPVRIQPTGRRESLEPKADGVTHGKARYYHPNGQLYGVIQWDKGRKTGSHVLYRENGTPEQFITYSSGQPDGVVLWMHPDGKIKQFGYYAKGDLLMTRGCGRRLPFAEFESISDLDKLGALTRKCRRKIELDGDARPSFDCRAAKLDAEKLICAKNTLARLDREIEKSHAALNLYLDTEGIQASSRSQQEWIQKRNGCAKSSSDEKNQLACLEGLMADRLETLTSQTREAKSKKVARIAASIPDIEPKYKQTSTDNKFVFYSERAYRLYEARSKILDKPVDESIAPTRPASLAMKKGATEKKVRTCRDFIEARETWFKPDLSNQFVLDVSRGFADCELIRLLQKSDRAKTSFFDEKSMIKTLWLGLNGESESPDINPIEILQNGYRQASSCEILARGDFNGDGIDDIIVESRSSMKGATRVYSSSIFVIFTKRGLGPFLERLVKSCGLENPCD